MYDPIEQKSYIVPSDGFEQKSKIIRQQNHLSAEELVAEFFDVNLKFF